MRGMPEGARNISRSTPRPVSRRRFFALGFAAGGAGAAAFLAGCTASPRPRVAVATTPAATPPPPPEPTPSPTPEPPPLKPRGREDFTLLPGTEWETPGTVFHSGVRGTRVMILGGVHGNEPGGWLGAEGVAEWELTQGDLLVVPRANRLSDAALERTLPGFGDLNRLYPGDPNGVPMARMAAEVVRYARAFQPHYLIDMHESWMFFNERGSNSGTAFIGQTVAVGVRGEPVEQVARMVETANQALTYRERLVLRTTNRSSGIPSGPQPNGQPEPGGPVQTPSPAPGVAAPTRTPGRGSTSLAIGNWVEGCAPLLVELGQMDQPESRRAQIHQIFARTLMTQMGMF